MRPIDADALKDKANDTDYVPTGKWLSLSDLDAEPTIEPKHGMWVLITKNYIDPQEYMCSVCGRTIKYYGIPELLRERYPYCNCGAKMERSEE